MYLSCNTKVSFVGNMLFIFILAIISTAATNLDNLILPDTAAGKRAGELMALFQSGDQGEAEEYVEKNYASSLLERYPAEMHIEAIEITSRMTPDLELRQIISTTENELEILLQSSNGNWLNMKIMVEEDEPHNILRLGFMPIEASDLHKTGAAELEKITLDDISIIVAQINELMNYNYVFPDIAEMAGEYLENELKAGHYNHIENIHSLSTQLTDDLQKITRDKHVCVLRTDTGNQSFQQSSTDNMVFQSEILPGNIGYFDLRFFPSPSEGADLFAMAMKDIENTDAIIFDVRNNGGGEPGGVQYLCSYLFDSKVHLNSLYWRNGDRIEEFWTLDEVKGKKRPDVPVYVLTSNYTFSGAEEFAYNLQTLMRATIIGETTGGGANPGEIFSVNSEIDIFIPMGRAVNPVTNTNWEGVGVEPDIKVIEQDALEKAIEMAKEAAACL